MSRPRLVICLMRRTGETAVRLAQFLSELFEHGHVALREQELSDDDHEQEAVARILFEHEQSIRCEFPARPPVYDSAAAFWGARQFYRACQAALFRDQAVETMQARLSETPPEGEAESLHYSLDLVWKFLPDLDRLSAMLSPGDPLRNVLRQWACERPLSSVGIPGVRPRHIEEILAHRGLRIAYVDRVIQQQDASRLEHPLVADLVRAALGEAGCRSAAWQATVGQAKSGDVEPGEEAVRTDSGANP